MKQWEDLSEQTRQIMEDLGDYTPTVRKDAVKGYIGGPDREGKDYLYPWHLRKMATACIEVAEYLEQFNQQENT